MKKTFTLIILTILGFITNAQWIQQNSGTTAILTCVYFADSLHGWVGTEMDTILRTTDSGNNWIKVSTHTNEYIKKIFFINKNVGWCASNSGDSHGIICKSTDGGITWNKVYQNNIGPRSIYFINEMVGWAAGYAGFQGGQVLSTTDGGKIWKMNSDIGTEIRPYDILFLNKDTGFVSGEGLPSPKVYKTTNGGQNWRNINIESLSHIATFYNISFSDTQNGLICGQNGTLLGTNNGGEYWSQIYTGRVGSFMVVVNRKPKYWIAGEHYIISSRDSGANWFPQYKNDVTFWGMCFLNDSLGWAVGTSGNYDSLIILKTTNGGVPKSSDPITPKLICPGNNSHDVTIPIWFSWDETQYSAFEFQVSTDSLFNNSEIITTLIDNFFYCFNLKEYTTYYWRVRSKYINGYSLWSSTFKFATSFINGIVENKELPSKFNLVQNYPNPFNPTTTINYSIPKSGNVKLTIYNAIGCKVATIVNEYKPAGNYSIQFNSNNLASGIYLYRLESGNYSATKKFILLK
jgi:photosystem II stability/assembly factor-like uncharacterized protein